MKFALVNHPLQLVLGVLLIFTGLWIFIVGIHSLDAAIFGFGIVLIGIRICVKSKGDVSRATNDDNVTSKHERARKRYSEWASAVRVGCLALIVLMTLVILVCHEWLNVHDIDLIEYIMVASFIIFVIMQFSETIYDVYEFIKQRVHNRD
jgi:hypothetical protein